MQVTDKMVEKACAQHWPGTWPGDRSEQILAMRRDDMRAALTAALSDQERAVEADTGTLRTHIGKSTANDCWFVRVYPCLSENDARAVQSRIRSALVDVPVEPVACACCGKSFGNEGPYCRCVYTHRDWKKNTLERPHRVTNYGLPHREGEDSAEVERLRGLLDVALEALDTYSDPTSYLDSDGEPLPADAKIHEGVYAKETASSIRSALAATRSGSATAQKGVSE